MSFHWRRDSWEMLDLPKDALPRSRYEIGDHQDIAYTQQKTEAPTFSMNPQERTGRHPVFELRVLEEPRGRSLILGLARNIVIRVWVWRRKPILNVLIYLRPWYKDSVSTMQVT